MICLLQSQQVLSAFMGLSFCHHRLPPQVAISCFAISGFAISGFAITGLRFCHHRFEAVVRDVLLGHHFPGLFFGHSVMRFINHQFMTHDFTTAVLRKGLQVKLFHHQFCYLPCVL